MIQIHNIEKSFEDRTVLHSISCTFEPGKSNLIIGQSGSGKTVLLKCIVGLLTPDNGKIIYDDINFCEIKSAKQRNLLRRKIGMLFQGSALFDSLTIEENVRFPMDMFTTWSKEEKQKRVEFCLERVDVLPSLKLFPGEISGGMQKRVAIARAIALNPKYLFCDEPNSGLDPQTALLIDRLIHSITQEFNMTTVINTHDMNSVMEIGDNIMFLNKGVKEWEGNKDEVIETTNPQLQNFVFASNLFKKLKNNK